jgi:hypothetical protein
MIPFMPVAGSFAVGYGGYAHASTPEKLVPLHANLK